MENTASDQYLLKTAVLFLIFNREDTTKLVFEQIKIAQPTRLYIASDGPRINKEGENQIVKKIRDLVISQIDWNCEIKTLFRKENLGCGKAVSSAVSWFFSHEEEGIILEDDVVPHSDFFEYCEILLEKYRNNLEVAFISGKTYMQDSRKVSSSYYFSCFSYVWGWASWRRVWQKYSLTLDNINYTNLSRSLDILFTKPEHKLYWKWIYWLMKYRQIDTWDYQLTLLFLSNRWLSIIPKNNLVKNIGFGNDATHTKTTFLSESENTAYSILPLEHPLSIHRNIIADIEDTMQQKRFLSLSNFWLSWIKVWIKVKILKRK